MLSGVSKMIDSIHKIFSSYIRQINSEEFNKFNHDFSQALLSNNTQEARRLLLSGVIHSATHKDFVTAACLGDLEIVNALLAFPKIKANIAGKDNEALTNAIYNSHLDIINRLLEFSSVRNNIAVKNNRAFRWAASEGNLDVVNRLLEFPAVKAAITAGSNAALCDAASHGHLAVVNRLLEFPAVLASVTINHNDALRCAWHNERHDIVARLRQIPAVAAYEAAHPMDDNLTATIAQDNESAIRNLSSTEQEELSVLKKRYADLFQEQGLEGILSSLRKHLIAKFQENPAQYEGQVLPLEYNGKLDKEASKEYYKNPYHTAYRYLFCKPNPWMAPDAIWVNRDDQGLSANISNGTKENIAYLWLAASHGPLPKGFTREDIQNRFIDLLVDAGRGHNWDKKRKRTILKQGKLVEIQEAFDDSEGDKPSCSLGVTKRTVAQFLLLLQPEVKPLNVDAIYLQFKERLVAHNSQKNGLFDKIMALSPSKLESLKSALKNFVYNVMKMEGLSEAEQFLLRELSIDASELKSFMEACHQDFSERFTAKTNPKWRGEIFDSHEKLIQHFVRNVLTVFYNEITKKCEDLTPIKPATTEAPAPVVPSAPAATPLLLISSKKLWSKCQIKEKFSFSAPRRSARLVAKNEQQNEGFAPKKRYRKKCILN